jgi:hypothetical protein
MLSFLSELWQYMRRRKRYWLLPVLVVLVFASGSALAPFIYTLF